MNRNSQTFLILFALFAGLLIFGKWSHRQDEIASAKTTDAGAAAAEAVANHKATVGAEGAGDIQNLIPPDSYSMGDAIAFQAAFQNWDYSKDVGFFTTSMHSLGGMGIGCRQFYIAKPGVKEDAPTPEKVLTLIFEKGSRYCKANGVVIDLTVGIDVEQMIKDVKINELETLHLSQGDGSTYHVEKVEVAFATVWGPIVPGQFSGNQVENRVEDPNLWLAAAVKTSKKIWEWTPWVDEVREQEIAWDDTDTIADDMAICEAQMPGYQLGDINWSRLESASNNIMTKMSPGGSGYNFLLLVAKGIAADNGYDPAYVTMTLEVSDPGPAKYYWLDSVAGGDPISLLSLCQETGANNFYPSLIHPQEVEIPADMIQKMTPYLLDAIK
ncbi:MAG: hypothetical protein HN846_03835 [Candidatus Pacebacteria bacterium]|jgi:hypothetical protein|nr:hypothetical protein [Candidatus Paceibacterota bacterium]MBT4639926.1 hypothetical protein [Deltaproteobacteria bacterium]MBT3511997.1 hypothetical protein [Candidatus Paceibacterota bacterium]MBT4005319.1 hypothetical protein [Candidatus Paceibacterota bacterium]MBT4358383.1 hypothetical protein [Candidatus Paceibacterota bacterium]